MSQSFSESDIQQLTVPQRLDLITLLWESIPDSPEALPMPESHRQKIERWITEADATPESAIPWEEVRTRRREGE